MPIRVCALIFDRDGTLVVDVPYNGDPERVVPAPGIAERLTRLRALRVPMAVVSNQSGIARGLLTAPQVDAVNRRVDAVLGPFDDWRYCPHGPDDDCDCRKPKPKLLLDAAHAMGVELGCVVVFGDKQSDMDAAQNAGMHAVRVTPETIAAELDRILDGLEVTAGGAEV